MVDHHLRARGGGVARCFLACLGALTLAACRDDGSTSATATTTVSFSLLTSSSTSTSTSVAVRPEEAEVRSAYEAASRAFIDAAAVPDPNFPALAATHTGPMLVQRRNVLLGLKADGRVIRYPQPSVYRIQFESVEIDQDVARLVTCVVDDGERVEVASGTVLSSGTGTVEWKVALRRVDGVWRLAERLENQRWEGMADAQVSSAGGPHIHDCHSGCGLPPKPGRLADWDLGTPDRSHPCITGAPDRATSAI